VTNYLGEEILPIEHTPFAKFGSVEWALEYIQRYGGGDGGHHKTWVLDQVARILHGTAVVVKKASWKNGEIEWRYETDEPSSTNRAAPILRGQKKTVMITITIRELRHNMKSLLLSIILLAGCASPQPTPEPYRCSECKYSAYITSIGVCSVCKQSFSISWIIYYENSYYWMRLSKNSRQFVSTGI